MMNEDFYMSEKWWRDSDHDSLISKNTEDEDSSRSKFKPIEGRHDDQVRSSPSGETSEIEKLTRRWSFCCIGILGEQISDALMERKR